jgi:hypothetical protein
MAMSNARSSGNTPVNDLLLGEIRDGKTLEDEDDKE